MLLLLFSKARNKLDETGVLIRAESIIIVYIRSGRDEGGEGSVNEMLWKDEPKRYLLPTAFKADRFVRVFNTEIAIPHQRGHFRIDSHVKCWIFTIICIILPGLCFKPEKKVTVLFIGHISWQLCGTTGMFQKQNSIIPFTGEGPRQELKEPDLDTDVSFHLFLYPQVNCALSCKRAACAWLSFSSHDLKQFLNSSSDRRGNAS